jgi:spore coat polysaccharide biosynthesis protein SpsF (cytidylyltransferase family)
MLERVCAARSLSDVVVATTCRRDDDAVASLCSKLGIACVRGPEDDVLGRFALAAEGLTDADYLVRLTGDCPLIDPTLVDEVVSTAAERKLDYVSNTEPPTWPDGLDVEVVARGMLLEAHRVATLRSDREHVTPWVRRRVGEERRGSVISPTDLSAHRWTLDEAEDYVLLAAVYSALYRPDGVFSTTQILDYLASRPEITSVNAHFARNEGYQRSLADDD